jgi:hypothetical protein
MAWFKYLKSTESINSSTTNSNYSYPYCKRFIGRFTPRDTLEANTWIFANISDININTYKDTSLEDQTDETSYIVTYEKGDNVHPVETVIEGDFIHFKTYELHAAAEEITGQYAVYYNTPNLRKINEVDNGGVEDYQVNLAPVWEDLELAPFIYGEPYLDGISAVGTVYSVSSGALPTGLSINSSTGQIAGTVNSTGYYEFIIQATTDDNLYSNYSSFSTTVYEIPIWIYSSLANIDYNLPYSNSVLASGYPEPTYSISSGELPAGITLNSLTGLVSGTTLDSGAYSFTVKAQNDAGAIFESFSGTVQAPPSWSDQTLGNIIQNVAYSDGVSAAGTATIVYSIHSGSLPAGLSFNSSTGAITGTTGSTGSYTFTIRATNAWGYISKTFTEGIYTTPAWTDSTIVNMIYGQAYSDSVFASGYPAVIYSISTGALPPGITLNSSTGTITGTSTTPGSYSFTVKAENAVSNVTQLFTDDLYVTPSWTDNTLSTMTYDIPYSDSVVATGSPTYTVISGSLPTGLSLNSSTGAITGTPTYYGANSFTIQAANETGSVTQSFSEGVYRPVSLTDDVLANVDYNLAYSDSVAAIGYPAITYSVSSGALPGGISLNSSTGSVTGTSTQSGSYNFTIKAENLINNVTQDFTGTVQTPPSWSDETLSLIFQDEAYSDGVSATGTATIVYSIVNQTFNIGDTGPGGGKIFITPSTAGNSTGKYFEVAPVGVEVTRTWSSVGNQLTAVTGADGTAIGTGAQNTMDIAAQFHASVNVAATSAAVYCSELVSGGYSDWFLPSKDELNEMYVNRVALNTGFSAQRYWSSSEYGDNGAWYQNYSNGLQPLDNKTQTYYVRPVRFVETLSLPAGLSLNASTGAITGTPTESGPYSFTILATNTWAYASKTFTAGVYKIPSWTDNTLAAFTINTPYSDSVLATGYPEVTYSVSSGALPNGISLSSSTGTVTGDATTGQAYNFTIKAENLVGNVTQDFSGAIEGSPSWIDNTLSTIIYNTPYSDSVLATGYPEVTYSVSSGSLPTGLSLNSSTGAITGTSTYYGAYSFVIEAINTFGGVSQSFSGGINRTPSWTDNTLAAFNIVDDYSDSVAAIGYPTITYSVSSGALPGGISLNSSTGTVTGNPTTGQVYSFTIKAENLVGNVTQDFSGVIESQPYWRDITLSTPVYNTEYNDGVSAVGYPSPTYSLIGYDIGSTGPGGGKIFITPSTAGNSTGKYFECRDTFTERTWAKSINTNRTTAVSGADGTAIGTGAQNTIDIVAQSGNVAATCAAVYCSELVSGGYSDWFLPSKDELNEMYVNRVALNTGFSTTSHYWSSSEFSATNAWHQNYSNGAQTNSTFTKTTGEIRLRPIRAFTSIDISYSIGNTGPGGGKIFITPSTAGNSTGQYFEVAPVGVEAIRTWATGGNNLLAVDGADGTAIGTGAQNTIDIVAQSGNTAATSAAVYCSEFVFGGRSDWFLPSKDELNEIYINRVALSLSSQNYKSSSESSASAAWTLSSIGTFSSDAKSNSRRFLAVRLLEEIEVPSLPAGLSLNASTGAITGTPTESRSYSFTIRASNALGYSDQSFSVTIGV